MAILKCCCWKSVRRGSFFSGVFTLVLYIIVLTAGAFLLKEVDQSWALLIFSALMLIFSALCVISSVLLLIGLCVDNRLMLLPWIVTVAMTTLLDTILALYFITDAPLDVIVGIYFAVDFLMVGLHVYCLLCVISQYQEYLVGRGRAGPENGNQRIPPVKYASNTPSKVTFTQTSSKSAQNGAAPSSHSASTTTSSSTTTKSFHPTDLSSITEEPSSYEPSDAYGPTDDNEQCQTNTADKIVPSASVTVLPKKHSSDKENKTNPRRQSTSYLLETEITSNLGISEA